MKRISRTRGVVGIAVQRVFARLRRGDGRLLLSIAGVALGIALVIVVTSIALGLGSQATVFGTGIDYWIVPETASTSSLAVSVGGPQLGSVHSTATRIEAYPEVTVASPVAASVLEFQHKTTKQYVLVLGVVASPGLSVAGLPSSELAPGDPHYANGTYAGEWTGEAVLSTGAAELLNASRNGTLNVVRGSTNRSFQVQNVTAPGTTGGMSSGVGNVPVVLVHLSELQAITGMTEGDTADQMLVATNTPNIRDRLATVYPNTVVVARSGVSTGSLTDSKLALAVGTTALIVALVVTGLFVATTMGLEVASDRQQYATLAAIGLSRRSRWLLVLAQLLFVTAAGGVIGVLLGAVGIVAVDKLALSILGTGGIAIGHPLLALYGIAVALAIGILAAPYLLWLSDRPAVLEELTR
jgi:putative ABC transport system permease protein